MLSESPSHFLFLLPPILNITLHPLYEYMGVNGDLSLAAVFTTSHTRILISTTSHMHYV